VLRLGPTQSVGLTYPLPAKQCRSSNYIPSGNWLRRCGFIAILALAGCDSILNPYVQPNDAKWTVSDPKTVTYAGDLASAIDYANSWRLRYYDAVGDQATLRNSAALGLLGIGGVALGYGLAGGGSGAVFAGLGAAGATLFGGATYFQNTPRDRTYLAGSQAIGCALLAVRPLMMSQSDFEDLTADLASLRIAIGETQDAVGAVQVAEDVIRSKDANNAYLPDADATLNAAAKDLSSSNKIYKNGQALRKDVASAGYTLRVIVDNIVATVADKLTQTEPDLSSLAGIVGGLSQTVTQLHLAAPVSKTQIPATIKPQAGLTQEEASLVDHVTDLKTHLADLADKTEAVASRLEVGGSAAPISDLVNCKVADVSSGFSVIPDGDQFTIQGGGPPLDFAVQAGTGIPQATLLSPPTGVTLSKDTSSGIFVARVAADTTTAGGSAQLVLSDATGQNRKLVTITVEKAASTANAAGTAKTATGTAQTAAGTTPQASQTATPQTVTPSQWETASSEAQREIVQRALNDAGAKPASGVPLKVDGIFGVSTREAIGAYQKTKAATQTYVVTDALFLELKAIDDAHPVTTPPTQPPAPVAGPVASGVTGAETPYEASLSTQTMLQIQTALGIPPARRTGIFDDQTRTAIMNFTKPQSTKNLTKEIVDRLLGK
jgi:hypothetical protein